MLDKLRYLPGQVNRKNATLMWHSGDSQDAYRPHTRLGRNIYGPTDIIYKFNEYGFRCDRFDSHADLPIVFLGCSHTEGIGLPLERTWSYLLVEKIRQHTGLTVPYWTLAFAGSSIEGQALNLYSWWQHLSARPKMVISFLPPYTRREYSFDHMFRKAWLATDTSSHGQLVSHLFYDELFAIDATMRALSFIDATTQMIGATSVVGMWGQLEGKDDHDIFMHHFPNFKQVYTPCSKYPKETATARDGIHWGPDTHAHIADLYWSQVKECL